MMMRVRRQGESGTSAEMSRPPSQSQQHAVYNKSNDDDREASKTGGAGFELPAAAGNAISMVRENRGAAFHLHGHNKSADFEHDTKSNTKSLIRMISQLRKELHLGLPWNNQTASNHGSAIPSNEQQASGEGSEAAPVLKNLFCEISHQVSVSPLPPLAKAGGLLDSFVYKNYPSKDRRTLRLPPAAMPLARKFSYATRLTESLTITNDEAAVNDDTCAGGTDFDDVQVDRRLRFALLLQVGHCLLRIGAALFIVYVYIGFLTSRSSVLQYYEPVTVPLLNSSVNLLDEDHHHGPGVGFLFYSNMFFKTCPFLGVLFVLFTIVMSGAWEISYEGCLWTPSHEEADHSCWQCQEIEDRRIRIEQANEKLQQAQRAKQQFIAYVFHNIRVPFNAIVLGLGHMQASGDGAAGPIGDVTDKMDLVEMMLNCAETMASVLDDVTDMGQWEVGQMELHNDEFDILAVIKFLSWGLQDLLQQKEIAFNMDIDEIVSKLLASHFVLGDKQQIVQTLGNFLSNAVKFTPPGGKLDLKVHCEGVVESKHAGLSPLVGMSSLSSEPITRTGDPLLGATGTSILTKTSSQNKHIVNKVARLRISVSDDGIGISAEDQARLFEPYSFVTSGWVQKGGVSGLGLSIAKRYVEQVGGNIGVESTVGKGSMFFFSIPFPLVPRNDNNQAEVLVSNSEAFQNSEASDITRTYDLSVAQKSVSRRRKSMEQEQPDTMPAANKQMDKGLAKQRHCSWKTLV
ncbi:unnamed protein product [Sphagnum troendelagicum]|uniref:histidine kinase n=1 Tax=Sphagnum troendelagicum TaxID=128251 RepID=A0ABP0ULU0_9BRYO